jgi:outer membrane lipoprotein LolB
MIRKVLLMGCLAATGCAALPPTEPSGPPADARSLESWELHARLALRAGTHSAQAGLQWVRRETHDRLTLRGPFGQGVARLTRDEHGASFENGERRYRATDAETLLFEVSGWRVPLAGLDWWIRGLPAPGARTEEVRDDGGRLTRLRQAGWEVHLSDYHRHGPYELPGFLELRLPAAAADGEELETRLVVDRWLFAP